MVKTKPSIAVEVDSLKSVRALVPLVLRLGQAAADNDTLPVGGLRGLLEGAIARDRRCVIAYVTEEGHTSVREVEPLVLSGEGDATLLLAFCCLRHELRTFRLARVCTVEALASRRQHRPGFAIERFLMKRRAR